jgi:hypothetical protein
MVLTFPKDYNMNLPKSKRTNFLWKKMKQLYIDVHNNIQVWFSSTFLYTIIAIIAIHSVINDGMRFYTMENLDYHYCTTFPRWEMFKNA